MQNDILENISLENIRSFLHTKNFFYIQKNSISEKFLKIYMVAIWVILFVFGRF